MRQRNIFLLFLTLTLSFSTARAQEEGREKMRTRLEQLFIWRVSDKLQLTPDEETKFTNAYKKLSEDRSAATHKMEDIATKLSEAPKDDKKARAKLLNEYIMANKKYVELQENEMPVMKKIFSSDQLVDYVLLKREMFHKFREALGSAKSTATADTPESKPKLKDPEVIQEK